MPRSRTRKGGRRKRRGSRGVTKLVPKTLRRAISKVNKAARSAARGVDKYALIKAPKMVLGPILKRRFGGRKSGKGGRKRRRRRGGGATSCCTRLHPKALSSSSTQKKGGSRKRRGGSRKRRGGRKSRR